MHLDSQSNNGIINSTYEKIHKNYCSNGLTYKSNQIVHKIAQKYPKCYPYLILLTIIRTFHYNQFEIIFFSHILSQVEPCYQQQPDIFTGDITLSQNINSMLEKLFQQSIDVVKKSNQEGKLDQSSSSQQQYVTNYTFTMPELRNIYLYLLVIGYAVKYYLNDKQSIKLYQQYIKLQHSQFFGTIFNVWAAKYGNQVLSTTPRKVNAYYLSICLPQDNQENWINHMNNQDCISRNYNEIVEQLIKAITEGDNRHQSEIQQSSIIKIQEDQQ